jgi:hypothetical protein
MLVDKSADPVGRRSSRERTYEYDRNCVLRRLEQAAEALECARELEPDAPRLAELGAELAHTRKNAE